ncbi:hypothetical protein VI26_16950 [Chromobacterium sp. LK1]|uniref:hypothetical protein n=1 Tax=Chromobacterium sp. LK1 TaxID=1628193 RepID=UPI000653D2C5|nr:hypothetical protein [Chromobacterium sp. LK1]KMN32332.1 hypothetical protein VI26_16950 [Chromobacterium sp. LK1]
MKNKSTRLTYNICNRPRKPDNGDEKYSPRKLFSADRRRARKPKQRTITDGCYNRDTAKPVTAKTVKLHVG